MNKFLILIVSVAVSTASMGLCRAQSDAPYTEGPVWTITMVKAKACVQSVVIYLPLFSFCRLVSSYL
jgi:hypothetical protein